MKPSDFQKTVQCRFESCLKKVVRSVVKDYYKELNRRKNKEISFSELPDVLVDKMAVWDDYETDYTIFSVCGIDIRVLDDELAEALKKLPERKRNTLLMYYFLEMTESEIANLQKITQLNKADRYVCEMASHGDCTPRPFQKKASDPRSDPRATVGKVVLPRPILTE